MKNNVLLFFKGGYQVSFANPHDEDALKKRIDVELLMTHESYGRDYEVFFLSDEELKSYSWSKELVGGKPNISSVSDQRSREIKEGKLNEINDFVKDQFSILDIEMIRSIEGDSRFDKEKIKTKKEYLRSLPKEDEDWIQKMETENWSVMNPFNNIFNIELVNGGAGYLTPPNVVISPPIRSAGFKKIIGREENKTNTEYDIFAEESEHKEEHQYMPNDVVEIFEPDPGKKAARAVAEVSNGSVVNIKVVDPGYGYLRIPMIQISPPDEGDKKAKAKVPNIDFLFEITI